MAKTNSPAASGTWSGAQAYVMAVICLVVGLAVGYLARGSASPENPGGSAVSELSAMNAASQVTPEQIKHMADAQAAPLLAKLQTNPNDAALLAQIGDTYYDAQQYRDAILYYTRSLQINPRNLNVRTDMGTALYYTGEPDRAIREFETALRDDPKHVQTLMNLGVVKFEGKLDVDGAIQAWETLLKIAPDYPERAKVEQMIARAKAHANVKPGQKTDKPAAM